MRPRPERNGLRAGLSTGAALVLLGSQAVAAAGAEQGPQLAATCASCHDPAGDDRGIPTIAGLDEQTIMRAMQAFRTNEAPSHVMHAVALSLTDEELASVSHYLATQGEEASSP